MKRIVYFVFYSFIILFFTSCADNEWKKKYNELQSELEIQKKINAAYNEGIKVNSVVSDDKGTVIHFSNGSSIQISNSKTPVVSIGENGNWVIDGIDTGKTSKGQSGVMPSIKIGENGHWFINGVDSGFNSYGAIGKDGTKIVSIVQINNEFWFYFSDNTIIKVLSESGGSRQLGLHESRKFSNLHQIYKPAAHFIRYGAMIRLANSNNDVTYKTYTPLKILFTGSSSSELQWNLEEETTDLNVSMQGKPLGFSNPNHWTTQLWQIFNPNSLDFNGKLLNSNGNMHFEKVEKDNSNIIVNGNFQYNRFENDKWILGDCGGYKNRGIHEFAFFKDIDDDVEFTLPQGTIGYSIIMENFYGSKSDGISTLDASEKVQIFENNNIKDSVNLKSLYTHYSHEYNYSTSTLAGVKVKIVNKSKGWMGIWGIEYWTDCCTQPIMSAISGCTINDLIVNRENLVGCHKPDVIVWQVTLGNDGAYTEQCYELYKKYLEYLLSVTDNVIIVLQHNRADIVSDSSKFLGFQERRKIALLLATQYNLPIVDWGAYLSEKYGRALPKNILSDGIHLSNNSQIEVSELFRRSFFLGCN